MSKSSSKVPFVVAKDHPVLACRAHNPRSHRGQVKRMRYLLAISTDQLLTKTSKLRDLEKIMRDAVGELRSIGYVSVAHTIEARLDATLDR
jgi:hypothetical protein